ncbi:MAG: DoxX protein [Ferruginibacter sp.]|jgi:putative oxidoreductase|uniref:DoxX family membrane protein n=1 Tax=Ferruginibacter sp. TaxID=1940288 RepID=UPI00265AEBE2|nr:DoxX family protein [Ferruginibacter sp.]MDB5279855.1 DoxX protein [Ferruginibacter sp.]
MKKHQAIASLLLRLALAAGFLSAVASRLSLWGSRSSGWKNFLTYTAEVNSFAPKSVIPSLAFTSTVLETLIAITLLVGYKTKLAALGATVLTLFFALAMSVSFGVKEPLDYSVFAVCAGAFLLTTMPCYRWSIDEKLSKINRNKI